MDDFAPFSLRVTQKITGESGNRGKGAGTCRKAAAMALRAKATDRRCTILFSGT